MGIESLILNMKTTTGRKMLKLYCPSAVSMILYKEEEEEEEEEEEGEEEENNGKKSDFLFKVM